MSIKVIDTLSPLGSFPVAQAKDIDVNGTALNTVLSGKANTADISTLTSGKADKTYVDTELAKKADTSAVNSKVDKVSGKGLSTNDYDNNEKAKVTTFSSMFTIVN